MYLNINIIKGIKCYTHNYRDYFEDIVDTRKRKLKGLNGIKGRI